MTKKRAIAYSATLSALLALAMIACLISIRSAQQVQGLPVSFEALATAIAVAIVAVAFPCAFLLLTKGPEALRTLASRDPLPRLEIRFGAKPILLCSLVIFICWIPWIVLQYPAALNGDAYNQLYQFESPAPTLYNTMHMTIDAEFIDHHPILDTLLYGGFLELGKALGSDNLGLFLFSLFQSASTALAFAACCCYLERLDTPKALRIVSLAFFALFPIFPLYAATMVKDSTFSTVFALTFLMYVEVFRTRGEALSKPAFLGWFIGIAFLCFATKKTGIYVIGPSMLVLLVAYRRYWRQIAAATLVPAFVYAVLMPALLFPAIGGVAPGGSQELFGMLYQQVINAIRSNDDLTDEEREAVAALLDIDTAVEEYAPNTTDEVKRYAVIQADTGEYLRFLDSYLTIGIRHPLDYLLPIAEINGPFLAPGEGLTYYWTPVMGDGYRRMWQEAGGEHGWMGDFHKPEPINSAAEAFYDAYNDLVESNLLAAFFLGRGLYCGWIPLICMTLAFACDKRYAPAFLPVMLTMLSLLFGPVSSSRYALPLLYITPLMLGLLCNALVSLPRKTANRRHSERSEESPALRPGKILRAKPSE